MVRVANAIRRELAAGPTTAARLAQIQRRVRHTIRTVDSILAHHRARIDALPTPTRRAYAYLAGVDFDKITTVADPSTAARRTRSFTFPGLWSRWQGIIEDLARAGDPAATANLHARIVKLSQWVERCIGGDRIRPEEMQSRSRAARGWLAFFRDEPNLAQYVQAMRRLGAMLDPALVLSGRFAPPARIEFAPISGLFRLRGQEDGTRVSLPTPMFTFSDEEFALLVRDMFDRGRARQALIEATQSEAYQSADAELEALGGVVEQTRGVYHDLAHSFERVNRDYFEAGMDRPRLTWNRTFTHRKLGHYDHVRDTVMISCTLDHPLAPPYAVDFVMYHELLHKKHGLVWSACRSNAHTPAFKRDERRFREFDQAEAALNRLAAAGGRG
ncbi:MAG: hypothetical protein C4547_04375 [Phycisphaerales bacterium]|nr:MAG: hypothetical protein C4547_04375 [Phycisphaerales bacterium]